MMQEQEIVRLEMKLKEECLERFTMSKELDQHRKALLEKDKLSMKQRGEIHIFTERIAQLGESNTLLANQNEIQSQECKQMGLTVQTLHHEIAELSRELEKTKSENSNVRLEVKQLQKSKSRLQEEVYATHAEIVDTKEKLDSSRKRYVQI